MKRKGSIYHQVYSLDNLQLADKMARRGKASQYGVKIHDRSKEANLALLQDILINKEFVTSEYKTFTIYEPKERLIFCLPYYPDRIVHHAIMNILRPVFVNSFIAQTYSCIRGRGIHAAQADLKKALLDVSETTYCLKFDIKKFYPSIDHDVLKSLLRKKIKDQDLLWLMDGIIDSADGVPIGNYLSQYLANFYLSYFDHWIKEDMSVKYYFRYADDIVILSSDKSYLHSLLSDIRNYLQVNLKLEIKKNSQVFAVEDRSIDFVGYRFYHTHILLRKSIKKNYCRMLKRRKNDKSIASYGGWLKHCNGRHLEKKTLPEKYLQSA